MYFCECVQKKKIEKKKHRARGSTWMKNAHTKDIFTFVWLECLEFDIVNTHIYIYFKFGRSFVPTIAVCVHAFSLTVSSSFFSTLFFLLFVYAPRLCLLPEDVEYVNIFAYNKCKITNRNTHTHTPRKSAVIMCVYTSIFSLFPCPLIFEFVCVYAVSLLLFFAVLFFS